MSDSVHAQRRQHLPVELFEQIMDTALLDSTSHLPPVAGVSIELGSD
jgi:hypothetical protein